MNAEPYHHRFKSCGVDVRIDPGVWIEHPENWIVGDRVHLRQNVIAYESASRVEIGSGVTIFPNVVIQGMGELIIGNDVTLYPHGYLSIGENGGRIEIGAGSHFAPGYALYGGGELTIGEHVAVAAHTVITTVAHDPKAPGLMDVSRHSAPIAIEDNVWIGANATILPGVRIATGCIVGAGAVLSRSTEPNGVYLGIPARRAKDRL